MNKLSLNDVKVYIKRQILKEEQAANFVEGNDSLDFQVDKLISSYKTSSENMMNESVLYEADDEDTNLDIDVEDKDEEDSKKQKDKKQNKTNDLKPIKKSLDDINVREFCLSISTLIENIDNLIEFKNTLLRRSMNSLGKDFNEDVVRQFEIVMEDEFGLVIGKSSKDIEDDQQIPTADRAGPVS